MGYSPWSHKELDTTEQLSKAHAIIKKQKVTSVGKGREKTLETLLVGKSHGRRSLAGYSPRDRKELNTTE